MLKFLLLVGLIVVVIQLLKRAVSKTAGSRDAAPAAQEFMVSCAHCGVNLPQSESVAGGEHFYCGEAHRIAGPR